VANARRVEFNNVLVAVIGDPNRVYFQPPESRDLQYPCIVYERDKTADVFANNLPYNVTQGYQVTYMDRYPEGDPDEDDSDVIEKLKALPMSSFRRHFATSGLNHDVFVIYH
jgi:hypothetical protein